MCMNGQQRTSSKLLAERLIGLIERLIGLIKRKN